MLGSKKLKFAVTTAAATAVVCTTAMAANVTSTCNVNVRSGAGSSYSILTVMKKGTTTTKLGQIGSWVKVSVNGQTGYVYNKYLTGTTDGDSTSSSKTVYITASSLNVRSGAGTNYGVIGGLKKGASATVVRTEGSWYKIKYGRGYGYISSAYTSSSAPDSSSDDDSPSSTSSGTTMYCNASALYVRSGKGTAYSSLGTLTYGQSVSVVDSSSYWYKVKFGNGYGYASSKYISSSKPSGGDSSTPSTPSSKGKTVYCTVSGLNVRSGGGTSYSSIGTLSYGQAVTVVDSSSFWYKIKFGNGYGYASSKYLSATRPSTSTGGDDDDDSTSVSGSSIVSYAKQFLGCSYVYGATGPNSFDCSGFTQYVYKHFGKSIPRNSAVQYANSTKISKSELRPGDLVFFTNGGSGVGHVAIYMGDGMIIHAANPRRGVCTDKLNSTYYTQHYVGCGRY